MHPRRQMDDGVRARGGGTHGLAIERVGDLYPLHAWDGMGTAHS